MLQTSVFRIIPKPLSQVLLRPLHLSTWEPFNDLKNLGNNSLSYFARVLPILIWFGYNLSAHSSQKAVPLSAYKLRNLYPVNYTRLCLDQMLVAFYHGVPSSPQVFQYPQISKSHFPKAFHPCVKPWDYPNRGITGEFLHLKLTKDLNTLIVPQEDLITGLSIVFFLMGELKEGHFVLQNVLFHVFPSSLPGSWSIAPLWRITNIESYMMRPFQKGEVSQRWDRITRSFF